MRLYELDFDKIKQYAAMRVTPRLAVKELEKTTLHNPPEEDIHQHEMVKKYKKSKAMEEYMPLTDLKVVEWLKTLRFRKQPEVIFKVSLLPCGKLVEENY